MGAGGPLQQPLLGGGGADPSAPPLPGAPPQLFVRDAPYAYAPAAAPPGVPPQQGMYPPAPLPPGLVPPPPPASQHHHYAHPHAPPPVVHTTHVYEGPIIQRVTLGPLQQTCPSCGYAGATRVRRERGCCTWLQAFGMCWLFCPLFWLPCCLDCSKDLVHRCANCKAEVARVTPC